MQVNEIIKNAFAMPLTSPSYPSGPYRFINREYLIITYETDIDKLKRVVPEPLEVREPIVKYEFIRMPDSSGFGNYTETGQIIPVSFNGESGSYVHSMYLNDLAPIVAGRELWGFPKKLASPHLAVNKDTLVGTLDYGNIRVATGTMGYKFASIDKGPCLDALSKPTYLIKILPHVDGSLRVCELVRYCLTDITIKGAWSGPGALELYHHALAPVADLPVKRVIGAVHIMTDLTLPYGQVVHDYLA